MKIRELNPDTRAKDVRRSVLGTSSMYNFIPPTRDPLAVQAGTGKRNGGRRGLDHAPRQRSVQPSARFQGAAQAGTFWTGRGSAGAEHASPMALRATKTARRIRQKGPDVRARYCRSSPASRSDAPGLTVHTVHRSCPPRCKCPRPLGHVGREVGSWSTHGDERGVFSRQKGTQDRPTPSTKSTRGCEDGGSSDGVTFERRSLPQRRDPATGSAAPDDSHTPLRTALTAECAVTCPAPSARPAPFRC